VKGAVDDSVAKSIVGQWVSQYDTFDISYEDGYHFAAYYSDGSISDQTIEQANDEQGASITMYNGNQTLLFLTPGRSYGYGMLYETFEFMFDADNPNKIDYTGTMIEGGTFGYMIYREGTQGAEIQKAVVAYEQYLSENDIDYDYCDFIYLDDDDIPELVIDWYGGCDSVLAWHDGTVQEFSTDSGNSCLSYREKTGEFCMGGISGSFVHCDYYKYENGVLKHLGNNEYTLMGENDQEEYYVDDELVSKQEYDDYEDSYGEYDCSPTYEYTSIDDAYLALEQSGF
jgi:hypothetical protein